MSAEEHKENIHSGHRERLRKRFLQSGLAGFEDHTVLELLLFYAIPRSDTNGIAHRLIETFGGLDAVFGAPPEALMQVDGIGEKAAVLIRLSAEAARRARLSKQDPHTVIRTSEDAAAVLIPQFMHLPDESVVLLCLDPKNRVIDAVTLTRGGPASASVDIRHIAEAAILRKATAVILSHNHPNGSPFPSEEDRETTAAVRGALAPLGIALLDHVIVAGEQYFSLADHDMFA